MYVKNSINNTLKLSLGVTKLGCCTDKNNLVSPAKGLVENSTWKLNILFD